MDDGVVRVIRDQVSQIAGNEEDAVLAEKETNKNAQHDDCVIIKQNEANKYSQEQELKAAMDQEDEFIVSKVVKSNKKAYGLLDSNIFRDQNWIERRDQLCPKSFSPTRSKWFTHLQLNREAADILVKYTEFEDQE